MKHHNQFTALIILATVGLLSCGAPPDKTTTPQPLTFEPWNLMPALKSNSVPYTVILGDHDLVDFGCVIWPKLIDKLPDGELTILEHAGHLPWIDRPDAFLLAMEKALQRSQPFVGH